MGVEGVGEKGSATFPRSAGLSISKATRVRNFERSPSHFRRDDILTLCAREREREASLDRHAVVRKLFFFPPDFRRFKFLLDDIAFTR